MMSDTTQTGQQANIKSNTDSILSGVTPCILYYVNDGLRPLLSTQSMKDWLHRVQFIS